MEMPFAPASSQKSIEEELCQCWEEVSTKQNLTISLQGAAMEPATMFSPPGNAASPGSHRQRGVKSVSPRESIEKMGPRHGAISKPHRQQRQSSKGPIKIYTADASNFKDLVHDHTSMHASAHVVDVAAQPTSPLTPQSASHSSAWGVTSQPSSPATPHSIHSSTASPLTSPQSDYLKTGNFWQLPSLEQAEISSSLFNTHISNPDTNPHHGSAPALSHNTNLLYQSNEVPRCALTPCLGISSEARNVPFDDGRPYSLSPELYARQFSLERALNMNLQENLSMSPRSYEKQLSFEKFMMTVWADGETLVNSVL